MNMLYKKSCCLSYILFLFILLNSTLLLSGQSQDLIVAEFETPTNEFLFSGPILIYFSVSNQSDSKGYYSALPSAFTFSVVDQEKEHNVQDAAHSNVIFATICMGEVVKPHGVYRRPILLDQYLTFDSPGKYDVNCTVDISVSFDPRNPAGLSTNIPVRNTISLTLIDGDESYMTNTLAELFALIKDVNNENNWQAAKTLSEIRHPLVIPYLVNTMDMHPSVSDWSIKGLGQIGTREAVNALVRLMENPPQSILYISHVKNNVMQELDQIKSIADIPLLLEMLKFKNPSFRFDVLCRLRDKGDTQCIEFAKGMLTDPDPKMKKVAEEFLESLQAEQDHPLEPDVKK